MSTENRDAEWAVLAGTVQSNGRENAILHLEGRDFTDPRHRMISGFVRDMIRRDIPLDWITLTNEMSASGKLGTPGAPSGEYVAKLGLTDVMIPATEYYADRVRDATRARELEAVGRRLADVSPAAGDELDEVIRRHRAELDNVPAPIAWEDGGDDRDTVNTILSETDVETDWLIPGWLAYEDRAVVVAGEGIGKSTLMRQFAIACAGGLNPWTGQRVADGLRVLFVDAENSRDQSRRAYRWIANRMVRSSIAPGWKDRIIHKTRNDGADLPGRDEQWFHDVADRVSPHVIILGPAYKLMRGDPQKDRDVQNLLDVIDRVRVAHRSAVLIETHAPHGTFQARDMRPYGSSVWLRWPEIGLGYRRADGCTTARPEQLEAVHWHPAREPRDWPNEIRYGAKEWREPPWAPESTEWKPTETNYQIPKGEVA